MQPSNKFMFKNLNLFKFTHHQTLNPLHQTPHIFLIPLWINLFFALLEALGEEELQIFFKLQNQRNNAWQFDLLWVLNYSLTGLSLPYTYLCKNPVSIQNQYWILSNLWWPKKWKTTLYRWWLTGYSPFWDPRTLKKVLDLKPSGVEVKLMLALCHWASSLEVANCLFGWVCCCA